MVIIFDHFEVFWAIMLQNIKIRVLYTHACMHIIRNAHARIDVFFFLNICVFGEKAVPLRQIGAG